MAEAIERCVALLRDFIGYRTDNPEGDEVALCERLAQELSARGADAVDVVEVPRDRGRCGYVYARYGEPRLLLNVHLDTVPVNSGWTRDPFRAELDGDRLYGLGASDTKGAIAAILAALDEVRPEGVGVLFSGDEEKGGRCIREFVASPHRAGLERAIVCEPTARAAGIRHRGVRAYRATYQGRGGHSSNADHMPKPVVVLARLAVALDDLATRYLDRGPDDMKGVCMNVAAIDGGVAFNVVPDRAELSFSMRPPPGFDQDAFDREVREAAQAADPAIELCSVLDHAPFACREPQAFRDLLGPAPRDFVPLQFWTEAAVLSAAGVDAVVIGTGDIAQAHAADEYVTRDDLAWGIDLFRHVLGGTRP